MLQTSNYIYGEATNNMHGNIDDAVSAGAISGVEAQVYLGQSHCIMSGKAMKGEFRESIQFKLDKFFKKDELDYQDFEKLCKEHSGDPDVTVVCWSLFLEGKRCYYTNQGKTIYIENFKGRFDQ